MKKLITGRNHYYAPAANIVMAVSITGQPSECDLKSAINKAVGRHEIFSSKIILDDKGDCLCIGTPHKEAAISIISVGFDINKLVSEQEKVPFDFPNGELIRFFIYKNDKETTLVPVVNHLAGDGMSVLFLIRDIMAVLESPDIKYDTEALKLMEDFGYPVHTEPKIMIKLLSRLLNKEWNKNKRIFSYKEYTDMFHSYWSNTHIGLKEALITDDSLNNLLKKCKDEGVSVNSAISAAFIYALKDSSIGLPVSVRPKGYEGMGNYASGISVNYNWDETISFWSNAREIQKLIYNKLTDERKKYFVLQFLKGVEPTLIDAVYFNKYANFDNKIAQKAVELFKYGEEQKLGLGITNLGNAVIPCQYGKYSIETIQFVPPLIPVNKTVVGVITINNKMALSMQYENNASKDYAKAFEQTIEILKSL